jgi:hypothetical protein
MNFPFDATPEEIFDNPDTYVDAVFSCLESEFLVMPKGNGFVEYPVFEEGYEALKKTTVNFSSFAPEKLLSLTLSKPISLIVLRSILGFTPPEWGYLTTQKTGITVSQGFIRSLDRKARMHPEKELSKTPSAKEKILAMVHTACHILSSSPPAVNTNEIHRLDKADTQHGLTSIQNAAELGLPYAMVLYERFLGRPFAGHRDSVSELIGDSLESAIEQVLSQGGISFRKTKRAERIQGFDQAPDFIIPNEFNPKIIIEAKITEDDGTARDKVTRIQHLGELSLADQPKNAPKYEVIACIGGRGFGVRREDMKKMILATRGKVFTLKTLHRLVDASELQHFRTK